MSYAETLTLRDAQRCRALIGTPWYQQRWGSKVKIKPGADARALYKLQAGGSRMSATRGGLGTGFHPSHVVVDDPLSALMAQKKSERDAFNDWRTDTLSSRGILADVSHVFAFQRLHPDDPAREILEENERAEAAGEPRVWHHVKLPMYYDAALAMTNSGFGGDPRKRKGELLWPSVFTAAKVKKLERGLRSETNKAAQLQQTPKHRTGRLFNVDLLNYVTEDMLPTSFDAVVRFWDKAGVEDDGCATAGALMGMKRVPDGQRFYILHMRKGQWESENVEREIHIQGILDLKTYGFDKLRVGVEQEPGSGGKFSAATTKRRLKGIRVEEILPLGDKAARAEPLADAIALGEVFVLDDQDWLNVEFGNSLISSSKSRKDQVDALAGAFLMLTSMVGKKKKRSLAAAVLGTKRCARHLDVSGQWQRGRRTAASIARLLTVSRMVRSASIMPRLVHSGTSSSSRSGDRHKWRA